MPSIKERRKKLTLPRRDLAQRAYVDPRVLQLIELNQTTDPESEERVLKTLDLLEAGQELPDWKKEVDAKVASSGQTLSIKK